MQNMLETFSTWWNARTGRERRLLQGGALLIVAVLLPVWVYLAAADFRSDAAARLASARRVEVQVAQLAQASRAQAGAPASSDGSLSGRVLAAAQAAGLEPSRTESSVAGIRVSFAPADSLAVYRWMAMIGAGGAHVTRTAITRVADSEQVIAEFDVAESP